VKGLAPQKTVDEAVSDSVAWGCSSMSGQVIGAFMNDDKHTILTDGVWVGGPFGCRCCPLCGMPFSVGGR
jgi:hypothetical protein